MLPKLDRKDNTILRIITENARLPAKAIAKKVGLSREAVEYRIKRLEKLGIIGSYKAKIDMTRFSQNAYVIFLRLSKITQQKLDKTIKFFVNNPLTMWAATITGGWDMASSFLTRSSSDLEKIMTGIENVLGENLKEYVLLTYTKELKNTYEDLFPVRMEKLGKDKFVINGFSSEKLIKLDGKDKKIIKTLAENAKASNIEISKYVGITPEAVRQRIKNLERTGVIRGYRGIIDIYNLNLEIYYVLIKFNKITSSLEKELETYFKNNPNIYYCARVIGRYDLIANITAKDRLDFRNILSDLRNTFSANITDFSVNTMFKEHKHTYLPEGILN